MEKIYIWIIIAIVVIIALFTSRKVIFSFLGAKLSTDNSQKNNESIIKGSKNKVKQIIDKKSPGDEKINKSEIEGDSNNLEQNQ